MNNGKSVCVFLGSNLGRGEKYVNAVKKLGKTLAEFKVTLVYGGGKLGLMGKLADEVMRNGGEVIGVITANLLKKEGHFGLTRLHVVDTIQERKLLMIKLADGCIILPGGLGTLEEMFEFWNAVKLRILDKPIVLLDVDNYYSKLYEFMCHSKEQGFVKNEDLLLLKFKNSPKDIIDEMFST
jgi:uncharacterized protein (TIGR00730 family)